MKRLFSTAVFVVTALFASFPNAAVLLVDGGGQLAGAHGVDVGGILYDVSFVDGTCVTIFEGCDDLGDFTFTTSTDVLAASQALLDQVFLGVFDDSPELTAGCSHTNFCIEHTPYAFGVSGIVLLGETQNFSLASSPDQVVLVRNTTVFDTANAALGMYAVCAPAAAAVPLPAGA